MQVSFFERIEKKKEEEEESLQKINNSYARAQICLVFRR